MMRKAQDRAGLHGGIGGLQGMKGMAGFGSTLASNKFVRAAVREEVREFEEIVPPSCSCSCGQGAFLLWPRAPHRFLVMQTWPL